MLHYFFVDHRGFPKLKLLSVNYYSSIDIHIDIFYKKSSRVLWTTLDAAERDAL